MNNNQNAYIELTPSQQSAKEELMTLGIPAELAARVVKIVAIARGEIRGFRDRSLSPKDRLTSLITGLMEEDDASDELLIWIKETHKLSDEAAKELADRCVIAVTKTIE